ncbi:MAG: MBL fold metallo-hydrolase [Candidatus Bathyarchaeia archaeon]
MVKITFLGTNGWYSTSLANTSCVLIDSEQSYVVLDAGDGLYKLDRHIKNEKPIYLFLSHLHLDHIIGLHVLGKFRFRQTIEIYGYTGTKDGLSIIRHPYTAPLNDLPLRVNIYDLKEGEHNVPFPFTCRLLVHADPCLGYRLELDNKIITYCTDTGVCENLYDLSRNADLLILECSFKPGQVEWGWPHLKPEDAATVAEKTEAKQLVLTHFDASIYETFEDREEAEAKAKTIFHETIAAFDGLELEF